MPIKFGGKSFPNFKRAVRYVQRAKKLTKERASAYVAAIARKQGDL